MRLRIFSSLVLAPPLLAAVWFGYPYFHLAVIICGFLALLEWLRVASDGQHSRADYIPPVIFAAALTAFQLGFNNYAALAFVAGLILIPVLSRRNSGLSGGWPSLGYVYIFLACLSLFSIRNNPDIGRDIIFWLLAIVWSADIGGYVFGRLIGGAKLAPKISPNKTWAGTIGGIIAASTVSALFSGTLSGKHDIVLLALAGATIGVVAQFGDLFESMFKRRFSVKDTGSLIPGHGGMLDRIDSILLSAPIVWFGAVYIHGGQLPWK